MKAIVQSEYGQTENVLRLEETDTPDIGDDQVLLHVHAAGVDRGTWPIGADRVIDYTHTDFANEDRRYDLIIDIGGNRTLKHLRSALTHHGTLVITGGETDGRWLGGSDRQVRALMLSPLVSQKLTSFVCSENNADLLVLTDLIESGKVTPVIDKTYPLSEVPAAIRYLKDLRPDRQYRPVPGSDPSALHTHSRLHPTENASLSLRLLSSVLTEVQVPALSASTGCSRAARQAG
jgi:NADPH:quinone reductase-like Zn-dependent oxidoreductase